MDTQFSQYLKKTGEYGVVTQVSHPIVFIEGLPKVKTSEIVLFETGQRGEVFTINRGKIEVRTFSHEPAKVGTKVTRTDQLLRIPVGKELLGHTITPLGELLDPSIPFTRPKEERDLDVRPIGISGRQKITKHMTTGVALIDLLLPLGKGQRELIIGDRKTGKTSVLLTAIKQQVSEGMVAIYAAIGKKKSDIKKLQVFFEQEKIKDKVIIVATSSYDSPSLIYQTPYAAMSIAEYFRDLGQDTLIILDDLSTQAKFYRELSLLARRFPGRDSYPGDIFYIHSKLLERGGCFKHPKVKDGVSITCLPVIEIIEGDLTGYVSTNVMGITDGHLYFDTNIYYQGNRPAVNIPLSVTRVGRQTLAKLNRQINKELSAFLTTYERLQNLSHFGQELTDDVKTSLRRGDLIVEFFKQPYQMTVPLHVQIVILTMINLDFILSKEEMLQAREKLVGAYSKPEVKHLFDTITDTKDLKVFQDNVAKNKDAILQLCNLHPAAPGTAPVTAQVAPAPVNGQPQTTPPPQSPQPAAPAPAQQPSQPS